VPNELVYIIIPTYNEKESLPLLIEEILSVCKKARINEKILIIDDNSPDGTGEIARALQKKYASIYTYNRKSKKGLGSAYRFGFSKALQENAAFIFEIDADLSHNPRSIPRFLRAMQENDLVLGSRYIPHASVKNWNTVRQCISRAGIYYARKVLDIPFTDLTTGFRCIRASKLRTIDLASIQTEGYGFQIELVHLFHQKNLRIAEIPITFIERRSGKSKFSKQIAFEAFKKVIELRKNI